MTRKDYILIADALRQAREEVGHISDCLVGVRAASRHVADRLAADNPRFGRERFMRAVLGGNHGE